MASFLQLCTLPVRYPNQVLRRTAILLSLSMLTVALQAQSASDPPKSPPPPLPTTQIKDIQIPRVQTRPLLEQFLHGNSRPDMKRVDDFRQRQPGDGVPVSRKTSAWIGYDDKNLYAVFVCQSPAGETRARLAKREDIFSDDVVGVLLDTYHDRQRGYSATCARLSLVRGAGAAARLLRLCL